MDLLKTRNYSIKKQYFLSLLLVIAIAILCYFTADVIGYRAVSLIFLLGISINAILFDIIPVISSALLSALIWNFFFIPPILTFYIGTAEDGLMLLMYFVIASINAVLTYKIRQYEKKRKRRRRKSKSHQNV